MSNIQTWDQLFKTAEEAGVSFDPIPEGAYEAIIEKADAKTTSNGKGMIAVTCKVDGGPYDGRKFWNNFTISPESSNAMAFFFRHMQVLGFTNEFFATCPPPLQGGTQRLAAVMNERHPRFRAQLGIKEYGGTLRNEVKQISVSALGQTAGIAPAPASGVVPGVPPVATAPVVPVPAAPSTPETAPVQPAVPVEPVAPAAPAEPPQPAAGGAPKPPF